MNTNILKKKNFIKKKAKHRINELITDKKIRLVGNNITPGIYNTVDALKIAQEQSLDLVEITNNVTPSIVKIIDYKKFVYEQKKKSKNIKSKNTKIIVKEIRFGPNTDDHDFDFKLKHAIKFINNGSKVRPCVYFKGRSIIYQQQGNKLLLKFMKSLNDIAIIEQMPKLEGKKMFAILTPSKKNK